MKIGLNSNVYMNRPIDEVIRKIYMMGYEGIEIARTHLCSRYGEFRDEHINLAKNIAKQLGIAIYSVQASWGPFTDADFAKARIDLARKLDAPLVNLGAGLPYGPKDEFDKVMEKTLTLLEELHEYAKSYGIETAIEPEIRPGLSPEVPAINKYQYYDIVLSRIPNMGLILDVEHAVVNNENPVYIVKKYRDKLKVIHISDSIDGLHLHLIPGRGEIDFFTLFKALKSIKYEGFISVEIYPYYESPDKAALASITYIQRVLSSLGD